MPKTVHCTETRQRDLSQGYRGTSSLQEIDFSVEEEDDELDGSNRGVLRTARDIINCYQAELNLP